MEGGFAMSWLDLLKAETSKRESIVPQPKVIESVPHKPKEDKEKDRLREKMRELENENRELKQNLSYKQDQITRLVAENTNYSLELQYYREHNVEIIPADNRNLQFLVNCVAKTYQNEFRKNRAPAVKLALVNIIEKFGLETPDEMG